MSPFLTKCEQCKQSTSLCSSCATNSRTMTALYDLLTRKHEENTSLREQNHATRLQEFRACGCDACKQSYLRETSARVNAAPQVNVAAKPLPRVYVGEAALVSLALAMDGYSGHFVSSGEYVAAFPENGKFDIRNFDLLSDASAFAKSFHATRNVIYVHTDHPNYRHLFNPK